MSKLVSIVLPVYNGEKYLAQSIESVLNQTYKKIELIIVNDCSTDLSEEIILHYKEQDDRIVYIKNKVNSKLPQSLNNGFAIAKGQYYTWTSDDNMYHDDAIEKMVNYLETHSYLGLICCDFNQINEKGSFIKTVSVGPREEFLYKNTVGACFLYRSNVAKEIGEYRTDLFLIEDYEYWLRINYKYPIEYYHEVLYDYRTHTKSLTTSKKNEVQRVFSLFQWGNLKKYEKSNLPKEQLFDFYEYVLLYRPKFVNAHIHMIGFTIKHPSYAKRILNRKMKSILRLYKQKNNT